MSKAITAFLEFCYIVCQSSLDEADLEALNSALKRFEIERTIFEQVRIYPAQHNEFIESMLSMDVRGIPVWSVNIINLQKNGIMASNDIPLIKVIK